MDFRQYVEHHDLILLVQNCNDRTRANQKEREIGGGANRRIDKRETDRERERERERIRW